MNNNRVIIILSLIILFGFSVACIHIVREASREAAIEGYSAERIVLLRTCRAKWPLRLERYKECVKKVLAE